MYYRNFF